MATIYCAVRTESSDKTEKLSFLKGFQQHSTMTFV